jgi:selenocysteine lyase/cysteine desulfurase
MLTFAPRITESTFALLREREFGRLDANGIAYLDYAGSALYGESQIAAHRALLGRTVFGNPHSAHRASADSTAAIEAARRRVLRFLDADDDDYVVCFTANTTAAIRLVAEAYPFERGVPFVLTADNHNSVNGVREFARRAGAHVAYLPLRADLRLDHPEARLSGVGGGGLFAYPAQSNFSGVHHPLSLVRSAQSLGYHVLLDAAAYLPTYPLSLRSCPADFVVLSFYKLFGYPTGVGALVARRDALAALSRPWFSGGTVDYVSVALDRRQLRPSHAGFEDGTPDFLGIAALDAGFDLRDAVGAGPLLRHVQSLTAALIDGLLALRHAGGEPMVRIYGPSDLDRRGGSVAFNVLDRGGRPIPYGLVEDRASNAGVHLRGGCFCNPGAAEAAFGLDPARMSRCLDEAAGDFSIGALQRCVGRDTAVGAVRASAGMATQRRDIDRALEVVASFAA